VTLYNTIARHVLAPSLDRMRGTSTMKCLAELEESQWWPRERIEELQSQRLRRLIEHAHARVPYYRALMNERGLRPCDIQSASDLQTLPLLTKDTVRTRPTSLLAEGFPGSELRAGTTSGSTGVPLTFHGTREDRANRGVARTMRAHEWAGIRIGDPLAVVGRPHAYRVGKGRLLCSLGMRAKRAVHIDPNSLTDAALPAIVNRLARANVQGLIGYPASLSVIASFIEQSSSQRLALKAVITGGEQLTDRDRRVLARVFGTEPYSNYSASEVFDFASECMAHRGLHIAAEDVVVEIVDDSGMPVTQGRQGRIVVTNLHNYGMPFIRYDLGDTGALLGGTCPCGRELPVLSGLIGRSNTYLHTRSGRRISPGGLYLDRLASLPVLQYQVVQEDLDTVVMYLVPATVQSPEELSALREKVHGMFVGAFGESIRFDVQFTGQIAPGAAGKHTFVFSKIAPVAPTSSPGAGAPESDLNAH
jgi:phenylacetate-CoA ligase